MFGVASAVVAALLGTVAVPAAPSPARQDPQPVEWPTTPEIKSLSDADLEARFEHLISDSDSRDLSPFLRGYELCLSEMLRRGDERWVAVVERARARWGEVQRRPSPEARFRSPFATLGDLELWLAQRRLERRPDPVRLVVRGAPVIEVPFPTLPRLELALALAEDESARPSLTRGGSYRSGRFERCRVEAAPGVAAVAPRPWYSGVGGGWSTIQELTPDSDWRMTLDLGNYLAPETPGPFRLRVRYHDRDDIADPEVALDGRLTVDSAPFELRWSPLVLARADVERVDVAAALASIDVSEPVPIADECWSPGARCVLTDSRAERQVLAPGWNSLPGLLEALEDCDASPERRAWILGLLFDLTGLVDPTAHPGSMHDHVGERLFSERADARSWRQVELHNATGFARRPDPSVQDELVARWAALGRLVRVE